MRFCREREWGRERERERERDSRDSGPKLYGASRVQHESPVLIHVFPIYRNDLATPHDLHPHLKTLLRSRMVIYLIDGTYILASLVFYFIFNQAPLLTGVTVNPSLVVLVKNDGAAFRCSGTYGDPV